MKRMFLPRQPIYQRKGAIAHSMVLLFWLAFPTGGIACDVVSKLEGALTSAQGRLAGRPQQAPALPWVSRRVHLLAGERDVRITGNSRPQTVKVTIHQTDTRTGAFGQEPELSSNSFPVDDSFFTLVRQQLQNPNTASRFALQTTEIENILQQTLPFEIHYDANNRAELTITLSQNNANRYPFNVGTRNIISEADLARLYPGARIAEEPVHPGGQRTTWNGREGSIYNIEIDQDQGRRFRPDVNVARIPQSHIRHLMQTNRITIVVERIPVRDGSGQVTGYQPQIRLLAPGENAPPLPVRDVWQTPEREAGGDTNLLTTIDTTDQRSLESEYWSSHVFVRPAEEGRTPQGRPPRALGEAPTFLGVEPRESIHGDGRNSLIAPSVLPQGGHPMANSAGWAGDRRNFFRVDTVAPRSIVEVPALRRIYDQIVNIEQQSMQAVQSAIDRGATMQEIFNEAERVRVGLGHRIYEMGQGLDQTTTRNRQTRSILQSLGHKVTQDRSWWADRRRDLAPIAGERFNRDNGSHRNLLKTLVATMQGEFGEARTKMLVPTLETTDLLKGQSLVDYAHRINPAHTVRAEELDGEVDVAFRTPEGRLAWGEVKNLSEPITRSHYKFASILEQVRRYRVMARQLGLSPEMHVFIVNGIDAEALASMETEGIIVHGPLVVVR